MCRWLPAIVVLSGMIFSLGPVSVCAQRSRGGPSPERMFSYLDSNGSGTIEADEIKRMPGPMRDRLSSGGFNLSQPIARDQFMKLAQDSMQARGEGSEGRGSRGGDRRGDDRRGGSGGRDSGRGGPGGGFRGPGGLGSRMMGASAGPMLRAGPLTTIRVSPGGFSPGNVRPGGSDRPSQRGSDSSTGWVTKPHPPVTIPLPEEYRERDRNQDGQLSFREWREWDRTALMEYFLLDANGDGFLVPRELVSPEAGGAGEGSQTTKKETRVVVVQSGGTGQRSGGKSSPEETPEARRAGYYFDRLDSNRDGSVAGDEWSQSRHIKPMFEQAKIDISKPMPKKQFVEAYLRASSNGGR